MGFVLTMANLSFFSSLLAFFVTSSKLTRWGAAQKKKMDADFKEGGETAAVCPRGPSDFLRGCRLRQGASETGCRCSATAAFPRSWRCST